MPRDLTMPEDLDEQGQRLWLAYRSARERERCAEHHHHDAKRAMRRHVHQSEPFDPTIPARYHAARDELEDARDERRIADMEYHAYRRMLAAQTLTRPMYRPRPASTDDDAGRSIVA